MGYATVTCLILLSACLLALIECHSLTTAASQAPCRKDGQRCYRTLLCETCTQTEIRCYEDTDPSLLNAINFNDDFCGPHGVVLVSKERGQLPNLLPLECSNGICPEKCECRQNPLGGMPYCCSMEKLVQSRCFTLDLVENNKEAAEQKITDANGSPVNISKVTIVLEKSDMTCLQGWGYSYKGDTLYMSNQCPVRLEICYEPLPLATISPTIRSNS